MALRTAQPRGCGAAVAEPPAKQRLSSAERAVDPTAVWGLVRGDFGRATGVEQTFRHLHHRVLYAVPSWPVSSSYRSGRLASIRVSGAVRAVPYFPTAARRPRRRTGAGPRGRSDLHHLPPRRAGRRRRRLPRRPPAHGGAVAP